MTDNVNITHGVGTSIAADDIGSVFYQRVKIAHGADGSATDTSSAAPFPVTLANTGANTTAVKVDGSAVTQPVSLTSTTITGTVAATQSGTWSVSTDASAAIAAGTAPSKALIAGAVYNSSEPAPTTGQTLALQTDATGRLKTVLMDGAGNNRSAAINASGAVAASVTNTTLAVTQSGTWTVQPGNTANTTAWKVDASSAAVPLAAGSAVIGQTYGAQVTVSTDVTRPADTTAYAANDCLSDSTSAPTSGGFTFTSAARISGGSGIITDAIVTTSNDAGTLLQGEIWIFDTAVTNINDNSAFAVSDSEIKTYVGKIPFVMEDAGNNGSYHGQNLGIGFTTVGSANLRFLVKVKNAYTPASSEVLTVRLKIVQTN